MAKEKDEGARKKKKVKPRRRPTFCINSSKSFNSSRTFFERQRNISISALKKNNEELAKGLNKCKSAIAALQADKLALERENMDLREEVSILRGHVDQSQVTSEAELQKRLGEHLGPVKKLIDNAMGNMVSLSDNLTQSMQLVSAPLRQSTVSHSSLGGSRSSSIGPHFRMRPVINLNGADTVKNSTWSKDSSNGSSPPKQLSKVSPMVAGHAITRPRIQLTRMDPALMNAVRETQNVEEQRVEVDTINATEEESVAGEVQEREIEEIHEADIVTLGRNRFDLTNIGEEPSILEESRDDGTNGISNNVDPLNQVVEESYDDQENSILDSPDVVVQRRVRSSSRVSRSRMSLDRSLLNPSRLSSHTRQSSPPINVNYDASITVEDNRRPDDDIIVPSTSSRPPADLASSGSPQVDILKTQRHPAVVLSDLVAMRHPALPSQYNQEPVTPHLPTPSPHSKNIIPVTDFPENPSESFLEQMCDANPMEGPSWLFASVQKKRRSSNAVRKLSAVWSDGERASTMESSSRTKSTSLDTSDLDMSRSDAEISSGEVSRFILDRDLIDSQLAEKSPSKSKTSRSLSQDFVRVSDEVSGSHDVTNRDKNGTCSKIDEEDMDITRLVDNELGPMSSDEENRPVHLTRNRLDESNISISVACNRRTPLKSLTYTDSSGEVVKFNPRTDTGVTVEGLRQAHILLNNVGMGDESERSITPYKLSECYIDLSPGRSMSLDQLFSLGLRAGISSPNSSPRPKKRKYASETQAFSKTPPSKKSRLSDVSNLRNRGIRSSVDSPSISKTRVSLCGEGSNGDRCTVSESTTRKDGSIGTAGLIRSGKIASRPASNPIEYCDRQVDVGCVASVKLKKKSVVPSFVLLEKSPLKVVDVSSVVGRAVPSLVVENAVSSSPIPTGSCTETESTRRKTRSDVVKESALHDPDLEEAITTPSDMMPSTSIDNELREEVPCHEVNVNMPELALRKTSVEMSDISTDRKSVLNEVDGRSRSRRGVSQVSYKEPALGKKLRQGDAGSSSLYKDFKPEKKPKSRKSSKK